MISLDLPPTSQVLWFSHCGWRNPSLKRLNDLPKVTKLCWTRDSNPGSPAPHRTLTQHELVCSPLNTLCISMPLCLCTSCDSTSDSFILILSIWIPLLLHPRPRVLIPPPRSFHGLLPRVLSSQPAMQASLITLPFPCYSELSGTLTRVWGPWRTYHSLHLNFPLFLAEWLTYRRCTVNIYWFKDISHWKWLRFWFLDQVPGPWGFHLLDETSSLLSNSPLFPKGAQILYPLDHHGSPWSSLFLFVFLAMLVFVVACGFSRCSAWASF